jgi:hypothetical protein
MKQEERIEYALLLIDEIALLLVNIKRHCNDYGEIPKEEIRRCRTFALGLYAVQGIDEDIDYVIYEILRSFWRLDKKFKKSEYIINETDKLLGIGIASASNFKSLKRLLTKQQSESD